MRNTDRRFTGLANIAAMTGHHPDPAEDDTHTLRPGDWAKLLFLPADLNLPESMWVLITAVTDKTDKTFTGTLANEPANGSDVRRRDHLHRRAHHARHAIPAPADLQELEHAGLRRGGQSLPHRRA